MPYYDLPTKRFLCYDLLMRNLYYGVSVHHLPFDCPMSVQHLMSESCFQ